MDVGEAGGIGEGVALGAGEGEGANEAYSLDKTSDGGYAIAETWNSSEDFGANGDCWLVMTDLD